MAYTIKQNTTVSASAAVKDTSNDIPVYAAYTFGNYYQAYNSVFLGAGKNIAPDHIENLSNLPGTPDVAAYLSAGEKITPANVIQYTNPEGVAGPMTISIPNSIPANQYYPVLVPHSLQIGSTQLRIQKPETAYNVYTPGQSVNKNAQSTDIIWWNIDGEDATVGTEKTQAFLNYMYMTVPTKFVFSGTAESSYALSQMAFDFTMIPNVSSLYAKYKGETLPQVQSLLFMMNVSEGGLNNELNILGQLSVINSRNLLPKTISIEIYRFEDRKLLWSSYDTTIAYSTTSSGQKIELTVQSETINIDDLVDKYITIGFWFPDLWGSTPVA